METTKGRTYEGPRDTPTRQILLCLTESKQTETYVTGRPSTTHTDEPRTHPGSPWRSSDTSPFTRPLSTGYEDVESGMEVPGSSSGLRSTEILSPVTTPVLVQSVLRLMVNSLYHDSVGRKRR